MEPRLNVIAATLKALELPISVESPGQRRIMQKAIYLAQEAGVPLGYTFGWHAAGPYSTDLADDYYEMAASMSAQPGEIRPLTQALRQRLEDLKQGLTPPTKVTQEEWLELLASVHFLRNYADQSEKQIEATIGAKMRGVQQHLPQAQSSLKQMAIAI